MKKKKWKIKTNTHKRIKDGQTIKDKKRPKENKKEESNKMKESIKRKSEKECISCKNSSQGITLLALVITIIIIIILSTVAISFLFGENGLITKAQQAKLQHEIETARETLTMILGDAFVEKKINPDYDQNGFLDDFIKAREPNVYLEDAAIGLDGHVFGLDRSVPELGEYQGELTGPRIKEIKVLEETTNSASIEVVAVNAEGATYEYWYKSNAEGEDQWKEVETDNKSNTCTISELTQGEIYNVRVTITTNEGSTTGEINVHLGRIPEGTITFSPAEWIGDGTAKTTINTSETGYTLQYQIVVGEGQIVDTNWKTATPGQTIEGLHHNETVYGRLFDGTNESKEYGTLTVKDEEKPEVNVSASNVTKDSITVNVIANDSQSGLATSDTYKYYLNDSLESANTNNSYKFEGLSDGVKYTIKVEVMDTAGLTASKTIEETTQKKSEIEKAKDSGQKYNNNTELEDDYGNKVWIPGGFNVASDSGTSVSEGVVIEDEKDNQFVWIPVGTYKLSETQSKNNELVRRNFTASGFDTVSGDNVRYDDDGKYSYYGEGDSRSVAYGTIGNFKAKAAEKGGFYIGRFEQGQGNQSKINLTPYNNIRRNDAMDEAESMYYGNSYVTSELMSSYAWDTALNFVCQTNEEGYTLSITKDRTYGNIGTGVLSNTGTYKVNGSVVDKYSNIYDLIGNIREWTTEYSAYSGAPCTAIGGVYAYANKVSRRTCNGTAYAGSDQGFRIQLYLK